MAVPALSSRIKKYLDNKAAAKALKDQLKPLEDENKLIEAEVLERLQAEKKDSFQQGKLLAVLQEKPNSVSWASEFLKAMGAAAAEEAKQNAGSKTVVVISRIGE